MKVLIFTQFVRESPGGAGRVAHDLAWEMSKYHDTVILYPGDSNSIEQVGNLTHVRFKSIGDKHVRLASMAPATFRHVTDFLNEFNPDVIHVQEFFPPLGLVLQFWAIGNRKPLFYTSHFMPSKLSEFSGVNEVQAVASAVEGSIIQYAKLFYKGCSAIITLNKAVEDDIRSIGYKGDTVMINNGRNLSIYEGLKISNNSDKKKRLFFAGHIDKRKNQEFLIEVMEHLPDTFELRLAGDFTSKKYSDRVKKMLEKRKVNVELLGLIPHEEIARELESSHILVSAALAEVQSLIIVEALASGTPVIGLANETTTELVDKEVGACLAKDASPEQFAKEVLRIAELSQSDYERMCRAARLRVQRFDWKNVIERTVNVYREYQYKIPEYDNVTFKQILKLIPGSELKNQLREVYERDVEKKNLAPKRTTKFVHFMQRVSKIMLLISLIAFSLAGAFYFIFKIFSIFKNLFSKKGK